MNAFPTSEPALVQTLLNTFHFREMNPVENRLPRTSINWKSTVKTIKPDRFKINIIRCWNNGGFSIVSALPWLKNVRFLFVDWNQFPFRVKKIQKNPVKLKWNPEFLAPVFRTNLNLDNTYDK